MVLLKDLLPILGRDGILSIYDIKGTPFVLNDSLDFFKMRTQNEPFCRLMEQEVYQLKEWDSHEQGGNSFYIDITLKCLLKIETTIVIEDKKIEG